MTKEKDSKFNWADAQDLNHLQIEMPQELVTTSGGKEEQLINPPEKILTELHMLHASELNDLIYSTFILVIFYILSNLYILIVKDYNNLNNSPYSPYSTTL